MLPKPPLKAESAAASEKALRPRRFRRGILLWGSMSIVGLLLLAWMMSPHVIRSYRNFDQIQAVGNAKAIGLALYEFETEHGKFPDESTVDAVKAKTATTLSLGTTSSNDFFRQLIATGISQSETMFYAKRDGSKRPDNDFSGSRALEKGEVGFAYLAGLSSKGNPSRPIVLAPVIPGTDRFDPKIFDGKAVILKVDNFVTSVDIDKNGHAVMDGMNLLDPKHPVWGEEKWKLVWPD